MLQDLRFAVRSLLRAPAFAAGAIGTLAIGIGVNSTIFTLANAVLFRPLPGIAAPGQLAWVSGGWRARARPTGVSYPDYIDLRDGSQGALAGMLAFHSTPLSLGSGGAPERIRGQFVTGSYFPVLGVTAAAGRVLGPSDDRAGDLPVVLSYSLWVRRFNASPAVLRQPIVINGRNLTVVGIARPGFRGTELGDAADLWLPLAAWPEIRQADRGLLTDRASTALTVIARLAPGTSLSAGQSVLTAIAARLEEAYPASNRDRIVTVSRVSSALSPASRGEAVPVAGLLLTVTALVLLIACANVANLLLARAAGRATEIGIRASLGASRSRIVRQLLTECGVLALAGSIGGLILSFWASDLLVSRLPAAEFEGLRAQADLRVLMFTAALACLSVAAFGLVPALVTTGHRRLPSLRSLAQPARGRSRLQGFFVVAQLSVSLVLLLAAGLSLRAMQRARSVELGFTPHGVLSASFDLTLQNYPAERRRLFRRELMSRLASAPGVTSVAIANLPPMTGTMINPLVSTAGPSGEAIEHRASINAVSPGYFRTLEIPFVTGGDFGERDVAGAPLVTIVNETLARRLWGDEPAAGRQLRIDTDLFEVRGVVRDAKYDEATEDPLPFLYVPIEQRSQFDTETVLVKSANGTPGTREGLAAAIRAMDPALPIFSVRTLDEIVWERPDKQRAASTLFAASGAAALLLAALGIYGVMAYAVTRRRREIGVRLALGATRPQLTRLVVGDALRLALTGVVVGSLIALPAAQALGALVFGIGVTDFAAFAGAAGLLVAVAAGAALLPARRAARLDPMAALRAD